MLTFLPETALRRTPSSLSRPKNCRKQNIISQNETYRKSWECNYQELIENLGKLNRAAISLILLLLYMAPITRKNTTQKQYPGKPIKHPVIMPQTPAPISKSQSIKQAESTISTSAIDVYKIICIQCKTLWMQEIVHVYVS